VPKRIIDGFVEACAMHPRVMSFVLFMFCASGAYAVNTFASKSEVSALAERIGQVEVALKRGGFEGAIRSLQSEIHTLKRLVDKGEAIDRDEERLTNLVVELGQKQRDLKRLDAGVSK